MLRPHCLRCVIMGFLVWLLTAAPCQADPIFADPTGDTFGSGAVQHDITSIGSTVTAADIVFSVTFAGPILPPSAGPSPLLLEGFIDLDTDQNPATGAASSLATFGLGDPTPGLGIEFYVDIGTEVSHPGFAELVSTATGFSVGLVPVTFGSTSFSVTVPLALLSDDGAVNYGVLVGTLAVEATDQAANAGTPVSFSEPPAVIPEPASLVLLAAGAGCLAARRVRRMLRQPRDRE